MTVSCTDIAKSYRTDPGTIEALGGVSFQTGEHEFLCILGPSGCGKTTLLKIIAGLLEPSAGIVEYAGQSRNGKPKNSLVFQEHGLLPWMSVLDNAAFGLEMQGIMKKERHEAATEILRKVGLTNVLGNYPHELSVGMKQRVGLARAIVNDPELLLMDEPFGSLDAQTKLIMQDELLKIWSEQKKPIIFITHDIEEAILLGDRVIILTSRPGTIKAQMEINIPRPRDTEIKGSREFVNMRMEIWHLIEDEVRKSMGSWDEE